MNVLVLIKSVPETAEADLEINDAGDALEADELVFAINEWDNYAVEEAVRIKEAQGGVITVMTLGDEEAESVLRRALAMGADEAVRVVDDEDFTGSDPATVAEALARAIEQRHGGGEGGGGGGGVKTFDLIRAGAQSSDLGQGQTAVLLAQRLGLPHATLVVGLSFGDDGTIVVQRELEANTVAEVSLPLPALITLQSGINQPRYVSILGIRKVRSKTIDEVEADDLDFDEEDIGATASIVAERRLTPPQECARAQMLEGNLPQICSAAALVVRDAKGGAA